MELDFSNGNLTLVLCPIDLRSGFNRLATIAQDFLNINVYQGLDWVVFISKRANCAKIIHCDNKGSTLITRRLNEGRFQQLLTKISGTPTKTLSKEELVLYLDGEQIEVKRSSFMKN